MVNVIVAQRDFSAGELDIDYKRADGDAVKAGARQMSNWRIHNSKALSNRPGRRVILLSYPRVDEVQMAPATKFRLAFSNAALTVLDASGAVVFTSAGKPWVTANVGTIRWDVYVNDIYICFPGMQPLVLHWDGVTTWTIANFTELVTNGNQKRTFFYRISPKGITLAPSANTGSITLVTSAAVFVAGHVNTRIRYANRQILITAVTNSTNATGTVEQTLLGGARLTFSSDPSVVFSIDDEIIGSTTGAKAVVVSFAGGGNTVDVLMLSGAFDGNNENVVGPNGSLQKPAVGPTPQTNVAATEWDDEVMNSLRGWPSSVFVDQNRVGFCNFPSVPNGIGWSAIGAPTDMYVAAQPDNAMFEIAPGKCQVFDVVPGPESSEFIFTDIALHYIPITVTNPLKPGSVAFNLLSGDGCANVRPRSVQDVLIYINAGLTTVKSIIAPGAYFRPFETRDLTEMCAHLFNNIQCIAIPKADGTFNERYMYVLNGDGTMAIGKYSIANGKIEGTVGWVPWTGGGTVQWVSALAATVLFCSTYAPNAIAPVSVVEQLDDTLYMDAGLLVNVIPTALTPPGGKGPLWWIPGGAVELMDQVTRDMGLYQIDANGFIVPQNNGGEDLTAASLVAGQTWTATLEPFWPGANPGVSQGQRRHTRQIAGTTIYVQHSTGFVHRGLKNDGTASDENRIPAFDLIDDATLAPKQRETAYEFRSVGSDYDPRDCIVKDTPGPINVLEYNAEISI